MTGKPPFPSRALCFLEENPFFFFPDMKTCDLVKPEQKYMISLLKERCPVMPAKKSVVLFCSVSPTGTQTSSKAVSSETHVEEALAAAFLGVGTCSDDG